MVWFLYSYFLFLLSCFKYTEGKVTFMNTSSHRFIPTSTTLFKKAQTIGLVSALALASLPAAASNFDVRIGNKTAAANLNLAPKNAKINVDLGYLFHTNNINVGTLGLHAVGQTVLANLPTTAGVGFEVTSFKAGSVNGTGLGLGGFLKVNIPNVPGLSVEGVAHISPNILTFGDASNMKNLRIQANYRLIPNAEVFAGYHYQHADLEHGNSISMDASPFIGMSLRF